MVVIVYQKIRNNYLYFDITIGGKKTSVGVANSGRGPFINAAYKNRCLEDIQKFKDVIWEAKSSQ